MFSNCSGLFQLSSHPQQTAAHAKNHHEYRLLFPPLSSSFRRHLILYNRPAAFWRPAVAPMTVRQNVAACNSNQPILSTNSKEEDDETLVLAEGIGHGSAGEVYSQEVSRIPASILEDKRTGMKGLRQQKEAQQLTYLFAAVASSVGITSLAAACVYYRFSWQMEGGDVPWAEMIGTFSLALGASVGMEYWARWAHRALWHHSLWHMHESHHRAREGPFELNDVFAIINAVPAIALMAFGFLHKGLVPGLCFGAGVGITVFGIAYMFVHDGLVHRRFPVGPIANVPYFQRVAAAHQIHHADTFNGVPYGLFLGPKELEELGGRNELENLLQKRKREKTNPISG